MTGSRRDDTLKGWLREQWMIIAAAACFGAAGTLFAGGVIYLAVKAFG